MPDKAIVVFTYRPIPMMLEEGGSRAWSLKPANARRCRYIVCTRNRFFADAGPEIQAAAPEEHGAAFLVGRIATVEPVPDRADRYIVRFGEYALLNSQPIVWPGARNPIWYVDDIRQLSIDPDQLDWQPVPTVSSPAPAEKPVELNLALPSGGLTLDQARAGLAITFGVAPANIEIVIRG